MTFKLNNSLETKTTDKYHRISLFKFSKNIIKNDIVNKNTKNCESFVKKENYEKFIDLSTPWAQNYGYPFHLSMKNCDTVLVKDVGITCALWKLGKKEKITLDDSEDKLIAPKQKKSNSSLTKKLNAYTKNLFDIFSMKITKTPSQSEKIENNDELNKILVATEYIDSEGRPCLRLRFKDIKKQSKDPSRTSIITEKDEKQFKNHNKSKLRILFLEMQTNNKKKSSHLNISSLFNNLTNSERSKKVIKMTQENINENNFSLIDNNKLTLPTNKSIATSNYCKKVKILHSSYSPRRHHNY